MSCKKTITYVHSVTTLKHLIIWTPHYYGQFALSLGKEIPYIFSTFNPLLFGHPTNTGTSFST